MAGPRWRPLGSALALALLFASGVARAASDGDQLRLPDALARALQKGVAAQIARLEAERAGHAAGEVRANYLPQVGLTSEAGWSNRYNETFYGADANGNLREYGLATLGADRAWLQVYASQILFDLKQWKEIEREELAAEVASLAETRDRDEVAYDVLHRYAKLVALEREAEVANQQLEQARWLDERAADLLGAGRLLPVERDLAELHRADADLSAQTVAGEIEAARAALWLAIGEPEPLRIPLDPSSLPTVDAEDGQWAVDAVSQSPELRMLDLRRRMDEASVAAAKANRLPTLRFVSGYSNYGPQRYDAYEDEIWVGVDLEVPIFDGGRTTHAIAGAQRQAEIARLRHQSTLDTKRARVRELVQRLDASIQRSELVQQRAAAAAEQLRLADLHLTAERGDVAGAVAARERHGQLARAAIASEYEQTELWGELQRELGRLSFEILGPVAKASPAPAP
jgi:outer membrane protein